MERMLVHSADPWDMVDEQTGEARRGFTMWFTSDYRVDDGKSLGFKPAKISVTQEIYDQMKAHKFPAVCELSVGMRPGAQGKAAPTVTGLKYSHYVDFFSSASSPSKPQTA